VIDPVFTRILSVGFGLMLLLASIHKLTGLGLFRSVLADYRILPAALVPVAAVVVPAVEVMIGLGWLFAADATTPAIATVALVGAYTAGITVNLLRGRVHISCGCGFGNAASAGDPLSWGLVLRNAILAAAAGLATLPVAARSLGAADYVTVVMALLTIVLLFAAANQLLRNNAAIRLWRNTGGRDD